MRVPLLLAACLITAALALVAAASAASAAPPYTNWQAPLQISPPDNPLVVTLGMLAGENDSFVTFYYEDRNGTEQVFERLLPADSDTWGAPVPVASVPIGAMGCTNWAVFPDGRIWLLMALGPLGNNTIELVPYLPGSGWGPAQPLSAPGAGAISSCARIEITDNGTVAVVWLQQDAGFYSAWGRVYTPSGGWEAAVLLETENLGGVSRGPLIALDGAGGFVLAWLQSNGTATGAYGVHRSAGGGWGPRTLLQSTTGYNATTMQLIRLNGGGALAVWLQTGPPTRTLWSAQWSVGGAWQAAVSFDAAGLAPTPRALRAVGDGGAVLVWTAPAANVQLWASRYSAAGVWGAPARVDASDAGSVSTGLIWVINDTLGNVWSFWSQANGTTEDVWGAVLDFQLGWQPAALLDESSDSATFPTAAAHGKGNLTLTWTEGREFGYRAAVMSRSYVNGYGWTNVSTVFDDPATTADYQTFVPAAATDGVALLPLDLYDDINGTPLGVFESQGVPYRVADPGLTIAHPVEGTVTSLATIVVDGQAEPGVSVSVNGVPATVFRDGAFTIVVPIVAGPNAIVAVASHPLGYGATATVTVTVRDLNADTQALVSLLLATIDAQAGAMSAQQATIDAMNVQISSLVNEIAALGGRDNASAADLAAARAQLNITEANLVAAEARLEAAQARLDLTSLQLNLTMARLDNQTASLAASQANVTALQRDLANSNEDQTVNRASSEAAKGTAGLALALAAVGMVVGFAGLGAAFMGMRRNAPAPSAPPAAPSSPPKEP